MGRAAGSRAMAKRVRVRLVSFVASATLFAGAPAAGADGWRVPARALPLPRAASEALRRTLAAGAPPDVAAARRGAPATDAEWRKAAASRAGERAARTRALAARLRVSIESDRVAGVPVWWLRPAKVAPAQSGHLFVHLHGGAYVFNGGLGGAVEGVLIAARARIPVLSIDYRMAPAHPCPAAIEDVVAVYRRLLRDRRAPSIALGGTSAGGGLTLAATLELKRLGVELPAALFAGTPWADLTKTGDTLFSNEGVDHVLVTYDGALAGAARLYAAGRDLRDPLVSPLYGDLRGFPPTLLVTGTRDLLLSDTARVHRKLRSAGVEAELDVYEGLSHADYVSAIDSPESREVFAELGAFLARHLR